MQVQPILKKYDILLIADEVLRPSTLENLRLIVSKRVPTLVTSDFSNLIIEEVS